MKSSVLTALVGLSVLVSGCGKREPLRSSASLTVTDATELPAPTVVDIGRPGAIGPYDKLSIQVAGIEEAKLEEVQVGAGGEITMPLVGTVQAAGRTTGELATHIAERLRAAYVRNPQVSVNLTEVFSQTYTVDGAVEQPGNYPALGPVTLSRAIASAKGVTEYARLNDVVVFRTVNKQRMAALYNLAAIRRGAYPEPAIYPNDVIVVGDSPARRLFSNLTPLLTAPLIAILQ